MGKVKRLGRRKGRHYVTRSISLTEKQAEYFDRLPNGSEFVRKCVDEKIEEEGKTAEELQLLTLRRKIEKAEEELIVLDRTYQESFVNYKEPYITSVPVEGKYHYKRIPREGVEYEEVGDGYRLVLDENGLVKETGTKIELCERDELFKATYLMYRDAYNKLVDRIEMMKDEFKIRVTDEIIVNNEK